MKKFDFDRFKEKIKHNLDLDGWSVNADEGSLMLLELMVKRQNGCYNSFTENRFLDRMEVLRKDGMPNSIGKMFMMKMLYNHSNNRPLAYQAMRDYRFDPTIKLQNQ